MVASDAAVPRLVGRCLAVRRPGRPDQAGGASSTGATRHGPRARTDGDAPVDLRSSLAFQPAPTL